MHTCSPAEHLCTDVGGGKGPSQVLQIAPHITTAPVTTSAINRTVTVRGTAAASAVVELHYHRAGTSASDYSTVRLVVASSKGTWSRTFVLATGYRVYATVGAYRSNTVLFASR